MGLATVQPGDKLAVTRLGSLVLYTVVSVSARYVKAKAIDSHYETEFVKSSGRLRGDVSRFAQAFAHVASESEIYRAERNTSMRYLADELKEVQRRAANLPLAVLDDLRYKIRYLLFDTKKEN